MRGVTLHVTPTRGAKSLRSGWISARSKTLPSLAVNDLAGRRIDVGQQVVAIEQRREHLVAHAGGDASGCPQPPAVLRVELPAVGIEVGLVEQRQPLRARQPEQEVAEAEAGVAAVEEIQLAVERSQVDVVQRDRAGTRRRTSARGCPCCQVRFLANCSTCEFWNCGRKNGPPMPRESRDRHVRQAAVEARILRHAA